MPGDQPIGRCTRDPHVAQQPGSDRKEARGQKGQRAAEPRWCPSRRPEKRGQASRNPGSSDVAREGGKPGQQSRKEGPARGGVPRRACKRPEHAECQRDKQWLRHGPGVHVDEERVEAEEHGADRPRPRSTEYLPGQRAGKKGVDGHQRDDQCPCGGDRIPPDELRARQDDRQKGREVRQGFDLSATRDPAVAEAG